MISDQIVDAMAEVSDAADNLERGSVEWTLMLQAHAALGLAHSLVFVVNTLRLGRLLNDAEKNGGG